MLSPEERVSLVNRLKRVEGQVAGVRRMIEQGDYCVDVLLQIAAVRAAIGRVGRLVLENHVNTCVKHTLDSGDEADRGKKLRELLDVFDQYADLKRK